MKLKLTDLHPNDGQITGVPKNPRFIRDDKYQSLKQSLIDDPEFTNLHPILVYDNHGQYVVVGGNMRFKAAQELKWPELEASIMPADTPPGIIRARIIKHNLAYGNDDWDLLSNEWDAEELKQWGMDLPDYATVNDLDPTNFDEFNEILPDDERHRLIICCDTEETLKEFMNLNKIVLDNNYKRVGKAISINWPLEKRRDLKAVRFE